MIDKLTPEQEASMAGYVEKYLKIGLSKDPIDYDKAVDAVKEFVKDSLDGKEMPEFEYAVSPKDVPKGSTVITYGNHEVHWVAYYRFYYDWFDICKDVLKMQPIVEECSWVYYNEKEHKIYLVERPYVIKMDEERRLHCENGPAVAYRDGFEVYSWRGVRIPDWWIMEPEKLGPDEFFQERNMEKRRVACEIVGWNKILNMLDHTILDEDGDPEIGTLLSVNIPDIGTEKFLRVMCGTSREFALPVPPHVETALEAQASLFGLTLEEFQVPEIRT